MEDEKVEFFSNYENREEKLMGEKKNILGQKPPILLKIELQKPENIFENQSILCSSKRDLSNEPSREKDFQRHIGIKNKEIKRLYNEIIHLEKKAKENLNSKEEYHNKPDLNENVNPSKQLSGSVNRKTSFIKEPSIESLADFPRKTIIWNIFDNSIYLNGKWLKLNLEKNVEHNIYDENFLFRLVLNLQNISTENLTNIKVSFSTNKSKYFQNYYLYLLINYEIICLLKIRFSL